MRVRNREMQFPRLIEIEQQLYAKRMGNLDRAVRRAWIQAGLGRRVNAGDRIGITVGSRGIDNIAPITRALVGLVREAGGRPFILPAMGSHGGATPAGQTEVLASLGVTPETVGAPIHASMATEQVGRTPAGVLVFTARGARKADGLIIANRVKQHTDYIGDHESGLAKMLAIGLGKREGARAMHRRLSDSLREDVPAAAGLLLQQLNILGGIAMLENGYHQTAEIIGVPTAGFLAREKALLRRVRKHAATLPFDPIDLLLVDWIGKDISGVGFDTHVIARRMVWRGVEFPGPNIRVLAALDLTPGSHGNALGVGLADLISARLAGKIDWEILRTNVLHTGFLNRAKLPLALPNDRELLQAAWTAMGNPDPKQARIVRIADTLNLGRLWISEGLLAEARRNPNLTVSGKPTALTFDRGGNLKRSARGS